jgi:hypothetical protein
LARNLLKEGVKKHGSRGGTCMALPSRFSPSVKEVHILWLTAGLSDGDVKYGDDA